MSFAAQIEKLSCRVDFRGSSEAFIRILKYLKGLREIHLDATLPVPQAHLVAFLRQCERLEVLTALPEYVLESDVTLQEWMAPTVHTIKLPMQQ